MSWLDSFDDYLRRFEGERISSPIRRELIGMSIFSFIREGYGKTETYRYYKDRGLGVRYKSYSDIYQRALELYPSAAQIQAYPTNRPIDLGILKPGKLPTEKEYMYIVNIEFIHADTDQFAIASHRFDTNEYGTWEELAMVLQEELPKSLQEIIKDVIMISPIRAYKRA